MPEPNENAIFDAVKVSGMGNVLVLGETGLNSIPEVMVPKTVPTATLQSIIDRDEFADRYISLDAMIAKEDGSDIGYIRVLQFNNGKFGKQVFPIDTSGLVGKYKNFIITGIQPSMAEKAQILKTNNTLQINAFDSQIEVLNIQGALKSTIQDHWDMAMVILWDSLLRLTKLVQMKLIVEFGYESNVYWGYPLSFTYQKSSNTQYIASFSMQFIVVKRSLLAKNDVDLAMVTDLSRQIQNIANL